MPKSRSSDGDHIISETGNWNVADSFSKIKVMGPLIKCDIYEDVALYGFESLFEELTNYDVPVDLLRFKGLSRLIDELIKLAKNTKFAMKKENTKKQLNHMRKSLERIKKDILPFCYSEFIDDSTESRGIKIREPVFSKILYLVSEIKSEMNIPLNKNHLIFTDKEEFDPRSFKNKIKDRMVNKG